MRKIVYIFSFLIIFSLGWFSHLIIKGEDSSSYHWRKLDQLKAYAMDPDNYGSSMGLSYYSPPFDETPHLEALVSLGELNKRFVLIPGLAYNDTNVKDWMTFANHSDVMQAVGQTQYADEIDSKAKEVLSFTMYYRPSFEPTMKAYIETLKKRLSIKPEVQH